MPGNAMRSRRAQGGRHVAGPNPLPAAPNPLNGARAQPGGC
jgi:hypothetical protein